jgi:hypothetical protein
LIISYGQLNKGKYTIILLMEELLPYKIFSAEWKALGQGKYSKVYKSFTQSEKNIPTYVLLIYVTYILSVLIFNIIKIYSQELNHGIQFIYQSFVDIFRCL